MTKAFHEDYKVEHVNTGCLYEAEGQKVTIAHGDTAAHFFDHSRMIDGTVQGSDLTAIQVIRLYVLNKYKRLDMDWPERSGFQAFYKTATFKDIAHQYRYMMNTL